MADGGRATTIGSLRTIGSFGLTPVIWVAIRLHSDQLAILTTGIHERIIMKTSKPNTATAVKDIKQRGKNFTRLVEALALIFVSVFSAYSTNPNTHHNDLVHNVVFASAILIALRAAWEFWAYLGNNRGN